jgi:hypothetical protein
MILTYAHVYIKGSWNAPAETIVAGASNEFGAHPVVDDTHLAIYSVVHQITHRYSAITPQSVVVAGCVYVRQTCEHAAAVHGLQRLLRHDAHRAALLGLLHPRRA